MGCTGRQRVAPPPGALEAELTPHQLHGETEAVGSGGQHSPTHLCLMVDFPPTFTSQKLHHSSPLPYLSSGALARDWRPAHSSHPVIVTHAGSPLCGWCSATWRPGKADSKEPCTVQQGSSPFLPHSEP